MHALERPRPIGTAGSDATRGLMLFARARPMGPRGVFWLKIHVANLYGMDKLSFDGRIAWVDKNMHQIRETAQQPLTGKRWWAAADKPFVFFLGGVIILS